MRQTHPEGMDEGPRRLGRSERLIMGDFDRHGLSFAVERSIANSYRLLAFTGLSWRHAERRVRGDWAQGKFEPQDRYRVRALDRLQAGRHKSARVRALGHGAKAR